MSFNTETTTQEWMSFLTAIGEISDPINSELIVCPNLTMFRTNQIKQSYVQTAKRDANIDVECGKLTPLQGDAEIRAWEDGYTIGTFLREIRSSGIIAVFTNALGNTIQQQKKQIPLWHAYAIHYEYGILAVYDPSYIPGNQSLKACTGVPLVKELIKALKGTGSPRTLNEVWFGGGGNDGLRCQEMTRAWVENEVYFKRGKELGNWKEREGWTKVSF